MGVILQDLNSFGELDILKVLSIDFQDLQKDEKISLYFEYNNQCQWDTRLQFF